MSYFIGVDVGTGSARAGVFDAKGDMLASAKADITLFQEPGEIAEQSSAQIWQAVCQSVKQACLTAGAEVTRQVSGLSFDATCSLVLVKADGAPVSVSKSGDPNRNIIVWMDHRATEQAERINATGHPVLNYVGGKISPEMETPKLLWLRENLPESFASADHFFDLTDYLTWRATGSSQRSVCTLVCKWTYLAHEQRWDSSYFDSVGLGELVAEKFCRIGTEVVPPGTALGEGLSALAASQLGLKPGIPVGAGLIDAHAGGIATVGIFGSEKHIETAMAYVFGTSACTMASSKAPKFVPGVWGPYFNAMVPGYWLSEGGQSAAGAAIDQLIRHHPAYPQAVAMAQAEALSVQDWLAEKAAKSGDAASLLEIFKGLHVVPDFNGNRAPYADPQARAVIAGLSLDRSVESLLALYLAGICGLGYGLRQIVDELHKAGSKIETVVLSGGAGRSDLVRQLLADASDMALATSQSPEPVLLGAAMLAATASGHFPQLTDAIASMSRAERVYRPSDSARQHHHARYEAFKALQQAERTARNLTSGKI